ncbi:MAG: hypothetical protein IKM61_03535 [Eubacteriaceae bacterium]|nr:hypothetical protein [Eubacteriaceae bacterium]
MDKKGRYDDIINLPHPTSKKHPRMSRSDRAAQFAPFSALTGFSAAIDETARLTEERLELDEYEKLAISDAINEIISVISTQPLIDVTYFIADSYKSGGKYVGVSGNVKKIDEQEGIIVLTDNTRIPISDIILISTK